MADDDRSCVRCGFLAGRDPRTRELQEVELESRLTGLQNVVMPDSSRAAITLWPICLVMRPELNEQVIAFAGKVADALAARHTCPEFVKWQQGNDSRNRT